ncbi:hypothetical protein A671_02108 [Salmonella enterica subsp. enterica serovar Dublin str. DG22]|nr:hypothetical protein [Escherichia coli]EPI70754.1 hypothetical protein A671_02108 [Salmonella enterica subsp. enterica serovar Dublin str. DG22]ESD35075.1 hypothetical protein HMPREF1604_04587 [Escherichia coli 908519]UMW91601.1 hypothetical protein [Escherichia coli]
MKNRLSRPNLQIHSGVPLLPCVRFSFRLRMTDSVKLLSIRLD